MFDPMKYLKAFKHSGKIILTVKMEDFIQFWINFCNSLYFYNEFYFSYGLNAKFGLGVCQIVLWHNNGRSQIAHLHCWMGA